MQSVPITIKVGSSNLSHGEVYSIQHYVIKFVSDLRQMCGFLPYYVTEYGTALTTILPILFLYLNTVTVTAGTFEP
jgi:hypothetical protein